jgi:hypothetical protein
VNRRQASVLDLCVARVGVHRGALAASYVARYAMTQMRLGRFPTAVEYADDWVITERTAWNHRAAMQAALGDDWPQIVAHVADEIERRKLGVNAATRTAVPRKLATA